MLQNIIKCNFPTSRWFLIYPFSLLCQCETANCPFLGRTVLYSQILSLVLKCPFWYEMMMVADSSYYYFLNNVLIWQNKKIAKPMSGPQVLLETVLVCEIKDAGSHCSEGKGRKSRHHTKPRDAIQSSWKCRLHRGHVTSMQPNLATPVSLRATPPGDPVPPEMGGVSLAGAQLGIILTSS